MGEIMNSSIVVQREGGNEPENHSVTRTITLHLLPGVLGTAFFCIFAVTFHRIGLPAFLALLLALGVIIIPFELGYLLVQGRKRNGRFSLKGVVRFLEPMPWWQYVVFGIVLFAWSGLWFGLCADKMDRYIIERFFHWLPDWFFLFGQTNDVIHYLSQFSKPVLVTTTIAGIILNGIAGPVVEELYFRGYLLPRLNRFKGWAPLINSLLFSLYHFFSPWENPVRILVLVPLIYACWWKRNIFLGMLLHCAGNLMGGIGMLVFVLNTF